MKQNYFVVQMIGESIGLVTKQVVDQVNLYLADGCAPIGGLSVVIAGDGVVITQAMLAE